MKRVILIAFLLIGCTSVGIRRGDLPSEPLVFVHRTGDQLRQLAELRGEQAGTALGHARLNDWEHIWNRKTPGAQQSELMELYGQIALLYPTTGEVKRVSGLVRGATPYAWSPSREHILVGENPQVPSAINGLYERSIETGEMRQMAIGRNVQLFGSYSPDGRVAFAQSSPGENGASHFAIYISGIGGVGAEQVSDGPRDMDPQWSPDGRSIVYTTFFRKRPPLLYRLDLGTGQPPKRLGQGKDPAFSPDGNWIVYSRKQREGWKIWRMRPDGTGKTAIGRGSNDERSPTVSPDGEFIAYVLSEAGRDAIWVRRFNGQGERPLVDGTGGDFPVW